MHDLATSSAFNVYALFAVGLSVLLLVIDSAGGAARGKSKTSPNPEDPIVLKGGKVAEIDPDAVARVMRAHRNAVANIVPFLIVTLVYVLLGATTQHVLWVCAAFSAARVAHAVFYIRAMQPWRSIAFGLGQLCTLAVLIRVAVAAVSVLR